uniref:Secreted protein n=1 Tax=Craspedostauros australis TaxID=1486917 RepID=A0A7R9WXV1_9STRA|mmetsp:Transcript_23957/g.66975  ORF Transcript_23957/g.66975 Transcript_23957/m.66975 type:complete len:264 (+) Transcript_23957:183-974(+)
MTFNCCSRSMPASWLIILLVVSFHRQALASSASATGSAKNGQQKKHPSSRCDGVPTIPTQRRACGLYIWDLPSAVCYKWCHHLLKDNLIEGRGGKTFVRYQPNSMLQLLYPCSRYSPDRCLVCGGTYNDHLALWWSRNLYSPYDRHLDDTYNQALVLDDDSSNNKKKKKRSAGRQRGRSAPQRTAGTVHGPHRFAFHRRYVARLSTKKRRSKQDAARKDEVKGASNGKRISLILKFSRFIAARSFSEMVQLQEWENRKLRGGY